MRLKKGDKVEVMNKKEAPVSWRVAEILSGNGHTYRVQYESYPGMASEQKVETVSRKFLRPCQPLVQGVENYISGDIVEVFYEYAWMTAAILKVLEGKRETKSKKICLQSSAVRKQYLVRLLGCSQELIVEESNIRTKLTWHDEKRIPFGKSYRGGEDVTASRPSISVCYQKMNFQNPQFNARAKKQPQKDCMNILDEIPFQESRNCSRSLKRMSPYGSSINEARNGHTQKLRAIEKDGSKQRSLAAPVLQKVDAVGYSGEILGGKNMHTSFKIISTGYNQMERAKLNDVFDYPGIRNSQLNSSDSDACSVGSCSVTDQSPINLDIPSIPLVCQETETVCSDAESCYGSGSERKSSSLPPEEEVEVSIHRLELHAYRRTLKALYASGPLSWEQESMLTNLRIVLHISNDEHLMELKNLISTKTAFQGHSWRYASLLPKHKADARFCCLSLGIILRTILSSLFKLMEQLVPGTKQHQSAVDAVKHPNSNSLDSINAFQFKFIGFHQIYINASNCLLKLCKRICLLLKQQLLKHQVKTFSQARAFLEI